MITEKGKRKGCGGFSGPRMLFCLEEQCRDNGKMHSSYTTARSESRTEITGKTTGYSTPQISISGYICWCFFLKTGVCGCEMNFQASLTRWLPLGALKCHQLCIMHRVYASAMLNFFQEKLCIREIYSVSHVAMSIVSQEVRTRKGVR